MTEKCCICKSAWPTFALCRLFGLLPITWKHKNSKCVFSVSKCGIFYSLIVVGLYIARMSQIYSAVVKPFTGDRSLLLEYITTIVEGFISLFTIYLILINIYRAPNIVAVINKLVELSQEDLLCKYSIKIHGKMARHYVIIITVFYAVEYSIIFSLNYLDNFDTNWNYERLIMPIIQTTFIMFHGIFSCICSLYLSLICCFDNKMEHSLQISPVHPMEEMKEDKRFRAVFCLKYQMCNEKHSKKFNNNLDLMEYLQSQFKEIRQNLDTLNKAFNPQILLHMSCELVILVIHIYAVIIFLTFEETTPTDKTNNFFNWFFIAVRILNVYGFLNLAQHVETSVKRLINYLIEYSTRISTAEEYQQVRIFVQQLNNNKGFTASGMFSINLQIAAPICANILMYVLVAVQFKIPPRALISLYNDTLDRNYSLAFNMSTFM